MPIGAHRKPVSASKRAPEASEAQIQRACCQYLDLRGIVYTQTDGERSWNKSGSVRFKRRIRRGWPDISMVINGRAVFAEVKTRKGKLSPHQIACHKDLEEAGAIVLVVRSLDYLIEQVSALCWFYQVSPPPCSLLQSEVLPREVKNANAQQMW